MDKKKVVIIGPIAPPFGGVSVHILRLSQLLKSHFDFDFIDESRTKKNEYFNLRSFNFLKYLKKVKKADLLYINSGKTSLRIFHLLCGKFFRKKIILVIHSFPKKSKTFKHFISKSYSLSDQIILVNEQLKKNFILPENKFLFKEAFIPPSVENESELPNYISEWIVEKRKKREWIICANASSLEMRNNEDVYGIDLCISACVRLKKNNFPVNFIFVVSSINKNEEHFLEYKKRIEENQIADRFLLINEKLSFVRLIQTSDIVIRSTNTDGDALTVREALFLQKPVLASDVVKRPEGTVLFKNRNINDLELKLEQVIEKRNHQVLENNDSNLFDETRKFYVNLFETVLAEKSKAI